MVKRAILVEHTLITRVIVDIPKSADVNDETYHDIISEAAYLKLKALMRSNSNYPSQEDITNIQDDLEVPYK